MEMHKVQRYGWKPDVPDHRDFMYKAPRKAAASLPAIVDLRPKCPTVYDQGQLGSCTANAIGANVEFDLMAQGLPDFKPARLQIYYDERVVEGTVKVDAGAQIRDGIKVVAANGVCSEALWPYTISKFAVKPPAAAYKAALQTKATTYSRVDQTVSQMTGCLASGRPFVIGFSVYESFESSTVAKTGVVKMPKSSESLLGGHAVLVVGYLMATKQFIVRNSWGTGWGQKGYFLMPFDYLVNTDLSSDFWSIVTVL